MHLLGHWQLNWYFHDAKFGSPVYQKKLTMCFKIIVPNLSFPAKKER